MHNGYYFPIAGAMADQECLPPWEVVQMMDTAANLSEVIDAFMFSWRPWRLGGSI